jgi:hypothetical protein
MDTWHLHPLDGWWSDVKHCLAHQTWRCEESCQRGEHGKSQRIPGLHITNFD